MGRTESRSIGQLSLDVVYLAQPIHSGKYLAQLAFGVTESFGITKGVFTVTRDNASPSTKVSKVFEAAASAGEYTLQQAWPFKAAERDVRCIEHITNLAAQAAHARGGR